MFYLFDANEKLTDTIYKDSVISAVQTEGLSEIMTLDVVVEMDMFEKLKDAIYIGHKDQIDDTVFQLYKIVSIKTAEEGISITAVHVVYDEMMCYGYIREVRLINVTASAALDKVLNGSRWKIGKVLTNKNANLMLYDNTRAEALTKLIESFQVELGFRMVFSGNKITKRYVDVYEKRGKVTHNRYVYGHKAINVDKEIDRQNVFTAIVPRGKGEEKHDEDGNATGGFGRRIQITDIEWSKSKGNPLNKAKGKDYLEIPEMTLQHGFSDGKARYKIVVFDEIEDPNILIQKAYETLVENCRPKVQLSTTIGDSGEVELGDSIIIIRKDIDVQYRSRVFKIKRNLITRENSEITLGDNLSIAKVDYGKLIESKIDNLKNEVQTSMRVNLGQIRSELEKAMFDDDAYKYDLKRGNKYNLAPGLYTFNRPIDQNPTKGIWIGAGKVAISNRKRADGTFDWTTWATGEGIVADVINAGTLQGGKVRWILEDGTLLIGNSINDYSFYWDGSTLHMKDVDIDLTNNSTVKGISESVDKNNEDIKKANDAITQTQTSVQVLKDSISSKVSKTEILSDKEIQNALKGRDGADGANGSNFTWNLLKKSNVVVENDKYNISNYDLSGDFVVGEDYTLTIWGKLGEDKTRFDFYNSESYVRLEGATEIRKGVYSVSFKWEDTREYNGVVHKGDNSKLLVYAYPSSGKSASRIDKIKLEKGTNANPVWSPHISEINGKDGVDGVDGVDGKDGTFTGEIGGRNLIRNSDKITGWTKYDGGNHLITDEYMNEFNIQGYRVKSDAANATDFIKTYVNFDVDDLIVGKNYTFSVYVKNNRDVPAHLRVNGFNWNFAYELQPNECKRFVITGKRENKDGYWKNRIQLQLRGADKSHFVDMTVSRPQLEEGDVATSWKPNPLDLISETQTVKRTFEAYKEQTDRRLLSTVSQTDFNKNNVEIKKQFSSVDQKANGIISTVSSNYTDLSKKIDGKPSATIVQSLISQKVDSVKIEVSDQISGVRSSIDIMQGDIKLKADKTDLWGLVSFKDLKDSNSWTVINGDNIKTGKISSADGSSWINLKDGNFSFYHNSLFVDENQYDWNSKTKRTRLHTKGTFRVSYGNSPSVELNSGGITLFKEKEGQDSKGTNKIQSNSNGNVQISSIDGNGSTEANVEIGSKNGYVMHVYGSLYVGRNLMVNQAIRYGVSCQKGTSF